MSSLENRGVMKSLTELATTLLLDAGECCAVRTEKDRETVLRRVKAEGEGFLTMTLPDWGKGLERALAQSSISPNLFPASRWRGGLPVFTRGFLEKIFDACSGALLDDPDFDAIRCLRQFYLTFGKMVAPTTRKREVAALQGYIETDSEVEAADARCVESGLLAPLGSQDHTSFTRVSDLLWSGLFSNVEKALEESFRPAHGPGATADRKLGNAKWHISEWSDRLEREFPFVEWALPNYRLYERAESVVFCPLGQERPVRIVSVPKTQRSPRIIAMEPSYVMYIQQGLMAAFARGMTRDGTASQTCSFESQIPNQEMAREGSRDGSLATLDLSEASDRVSCLHVWNLLRHHRTLFDAVMAVRTPRADVLGQTISLSKYASMGSALTFPLESLVFTTVVFLGIERAIGHRLNKGSLRHWLTQVRVYGDDIIVPARLAPSVIEALEAYGFKVNSHKSFWTGRFRESCGADWYDGRSVRAVRVRSRLPRAQKDAEEIVSLVSFGNQLRAASGYPRSVALVDAHLRRLIPLPWVTSSSVLLGRIDPNDSHHVSGESRWDSNIHQTQVRGLLVRAQPPRNPIRDGWAALLKFFLKGSDDPLEKEHLLRSGRPRTVRLKTGWSKP